MEKLILRLSVPTIISMLVSSIYNMADTYFVSQLGTSASAAVGIVFSLMAILQAVGFTVGMGAGILSSRLLGAGKNAEANRTASSAFFLSVVLSLLITVPGLLNLKSLMRFLGSTETILPYAEAYGRYILLAAPVICASFVMNNLLRNEGKAAFAMIGITTGGILNIALDPLFIFTFGLGTAGAAIATAISQCVSFLILLSMFLLKKSNLELNIKYVSRKAATYLSILKTGLPTLSRQGLASIATMLLNVQAARYGDTAVAAMSISGRITFFPVLSTPWIRTGLPAGCRIQLRCRKV
ncbi:MAG: MATE family efflux transporter [Bullifex sp.]